MHATHQICRRQFFWQPRLLLLPISSHGSTTATVSSWIHLVLSSSLSRKFKTFAARLVLLAPRHRHLTPLLENCTGFPFQNVLTIKSLVRVSVLSVVLVLLTFLNCYMSKLHLIPYALLLKIQQYKRKSHGFRAFSCFGPHIWNSLSQDLRHCSTLSSLKAKLKTFLFSQYFHPN